MTRLILSPVVLLEDCFLSSAVPDQQVGSDLISVGYSLFYFEVNRRGKIRLFGLGLDLIVFLRFNYGLETKCSVIHILIKIFNFCFSFG